MSEFEVPVLNTWRAIAKTAIELVKIGDDGIIDPAGAFPGAYGITPSGAFLVHPDGFVGWRWEKSA